MENASGNPHGSGLGRTRVSFLRDRSVEKIWKAVGLAAVLLALFLVLWHG
jgi:hypothetical protein